MKTWGDVKLATLQKLFSSNGTQIVVDSSTTEYINAMPQACMEALQMLATAGKFIHKMIEIQNERYENLLSTGFSQYRLFNESMSFTAKNAGSYYFDALGDLTVDIKVNGETVESLAIHAPHFDGFKGLINYPGDVELVFTSEHPASIKNVCLYRESFADADDVPQYGEYIFYSLPELAEDYYQLAEDDIYYINPGNEPTYIAATDVYQEANETLVLRRNKPGTYRIYYKAYPADINLNTPDDYVLPLDPEVVVLLPLYMASQLYKEDDNSIATGYRNEWEVAFERLQNGSNIPRKESFVSNSGW